MFSKYHCMKLNGLKYFLVLGILIWALGCNTSASASGLCNHCLRMANPELSRLSIEHAIQSINILTGEKTEIHKTLRAIPHSFESVLNQISFNPVFAEHPDLSGENQNRTSFRFLSFLKI